VRAAAKENDLKPEQIVDGLMEGHESAFEALYSYLIEINSFFLRRASQRPDAEDLYHETIATVAIQVRSGQLRRPELLRTYATSIARHKLTAYYEEKRRTDRMPHEHWEQRPARDPDAESLCRASEQREIALRVMRGLSSRERDILKRFYLEGLSAETIQREMSLTPTQFRLIKSRAKQRFYELCQARLAMRKPPQRSNSTYEKLEEIA
jgi:RNA polymerase sigma-70 factor (ECF subfamily)